VMQLYPTPMQSSLFDPWKHCCSGIVEPIKAGVRDAKLGVGKQEQDDFYTAEENIQRKKLEVELEETEEQAKKREVYLNTSVCNRSSFSHGLVESLGLS
jgi:hypothetical protein